MEKNEDLDLLKLQALALKHKTSKRQKTLDEKILIVKAHLLNHVSISQLSRDFGISRRAIYKWIYTFADRNVPERKSRVVSVVEPNPLPMPKKKQNPDESAS